VDGNALAAVVTAAAGLITAVGGAVTVMRQARREELAVCLERSQQHDRWRGIALRHLGALERCLWEGRISVPVRPDELY
jgi:hypothetical protein